ncbi:MAG TPA: VOC family protein [Puia sp.]|jgi:glyoxylase I family protein|nr:VOC family protein [Puia sp.]
MEINNQIDSLKIYGIAPLLQVFDMPTSLVFYRDKLGFKINLQSEPEKGDDCNFVYLKMDEIELMLNTQYEKKNRPNAPDESRIRAHNDTVLYFGCADIDALYKKFRAVGLEMKEPAITQYNFKAIHFSDPDGYGLCFHWPVK